MAAASRRLPGSAWSGENMPGAVTKPSAFGAAARRRAPSRATAAGSALRAGQPEHPPVRLDEGAVERQRRATCAGEAVDAVALGAGRPPACRPARSSPRPRATLPRFSARLRVRLTTDHRRRPLGARRRPAWPRAASASWSGRKLWTQRSRSARHQVEEGATARRAARGRRPRPGSASAPRLEGERQAVDVWRHARARGAAPYSFSIVHCSGCWLRRA